MNEIKKAGMTRSEKKAEREQKKAERFLRELKPGEAILAMGEFSGLKPFLFDLAAVIALIVVNRFMIGKAAVTLLINILVVLFSFEASKALANAQSSVAIATNRRILGTVNMKPFDIKYRDLNSIGLPERLFLDTGDPGSSVLLKNVTNAREFYHVIRPLYDKAHD